MLWNIKIIISNISEKYSNSIDRKKNIYLNKIILSKKLAKRNSRKPSKRLKIISHKKQNMPFENKDDFIYWTKTRCTW